MAEPSKPTEGPEAKPSGKASAAKKRGKAGKAKLKPGQKRGEKSAREWAIEYLKAHRGKAKFGELVKWVSEKMGGNLTWVPTYYMKSPGFSRPERGVVAYSEKKAKAGKEAIAEARKERLAKIRPKAGKKAGKKGKKAPKKETTKERRERTAREMKEREARDKAEFDEAAEAAEESDQ